MITTKKEQLKSYSNHYFNIFFYFEMLKSIIDGANDFTAFNYDWANKGQNAITLLMRRAKIRYTRFESNLLKNEPSKSNIENILNLQQTIVARCIKSIVKREFPRLENLLYVLDDVSYVQIFIGYLHVYYKRLHENRPDFMATALKTSLKELQPFIHSRPKYNDFNPAISHFHLQREDFLKKKENEKRRKAIRYRAEVYKKIKDKIAEISVEHLGLNTLVAMTYDSKLELLEKYNYYIKNVPGSGMHKLMVFYILKNLTTYDEQFFESAAKENSALKYKIYKNAVLDKITAAYPLLRDVCELLKNNKQAQN